MARTVFLCTGQWTDLPLADLASKAAEWGYQGLDLACWGDHFEVQRALNEDDYCQSKLDLLSRSDLTVSVLSVHGVGHAVCGPIDARFQSLLPDYVWGDGDIEGVQERAAEELLATVQAATKLGVGTLCALTGSPLASSLFGFPSLDIDFVNRGVESFAQAWHPILQACKNASLRFAAQVEPGQMVFDIASAELVLEALEGREEFGFTFDPSTLHWQGIDPVEFIRRFPNRIYHVHIKDMAIRLNGRTSLVGTCWPAGDPRRGWDFRSPGHGGVDWEGVIRALNDIGYTGPLAVDWQDAGMNRDFGGEDACKFVKRLDFEAAAAGGDTPFRLS